MFYFACQKIGDGFNASMGMPGETGEIIIGIVGTKMIQHQKGIEGRPLIEAENPFEFDSCPIYGRNGFDDIGQSATSAHFTPSSQASSSLSGLDVSIVCAFSQGSRLDFAFFCVFCFFVSSSFLSAIKTSLALAYYLKYRKAPLSANS
ncbi:MAG: hypothetical protein WC820_03490, partial [Spirochaetales bacterium]